ncbi:MAG: N-acetyl-gamma-glutamyl-phosphate reductase [Sulfurospirillaceae bacterium]|nr:N-acetyl-gamma-glutamyl-phosphate reductase [Sulfurospirillaceae bacterium]
MSDIENKIPVAIIGASGYTGLELIKLIITHPKFEIAYVGTSEGGVKVEDLHPSLRSVLSKEVVKSDAKDIAKVAKVAFLALPHKTSMGFAKELLKLGVKVVDLSADYRLELDTYEKHYCPHTDKNNIANAVYGLPEFYREKIKTTSLVANPGCYPTAALLSVLPFCEYIDPNYPIFMDAKSGVSGAGKKCTEKTHFVSVDENIFAYNPMTHRHEPEIKEKMKLHSGIDFDINFVPHLLPIIRGEMVDSYMLLKEEGLDALKLLREFYKDEPFIRIYEQPVDMKSPSGTHFCDIFAKVVGKKLYLNATIDNILRGSSSQAVANANLMFGFEESLGMPVISYVP